MSQMSGVAGDGFSAPGQRAISSGRAVLLLALAVVLSVVLLQALDDSPTGLTTTAQESTPAPQEATPAADTPAVAPQVRTPSEVNVLVANGTTVNGAANKVAGRLQPIGYKLLKPGNTATPSTTSVVQYVPGYQAEAQALATSLGISSSAVQAMPNPAPIADLQGANVLVIIGNELAGQQPATNAAGNAATANAQSTTPTTAASVNPASGPLNATPTTAQTTQR